MKREYIIRAVAAGIVFFSAYTLPNLISAAGLRIGTDPTLHSIFVNVLQFLICIAGIVLVYRVGPIKAIAELGLQMPIPRAGLFALLATSPMLIGFAISSGLSPELLISNIFAFAIVSPFAEEALFRGYIFRQLYRRVKTGFWPAVLLPSLLFGLGHMYQSRGIWDFVGITLITGLGSVFFAWTFMRWNDNLWVPFGLHFLMNFWWMIFAVDETAIGGWIANGARLLTVIVAVVLTINKDRIWKPLPIEEQNIADSNESPDKAPEQKKRVIAAV